MIQRVGDNPELAYETRNAVPSSLPELGTRLSVVMDRIGGRQKASDIAGRSKDQLWKWSRGSAEPPFRALAALCTEAGVRMEWLATGHGPMLLASGAVSEGAPAPYGAAEASAPDPDRLAEAIRLVESPPIARRGLPAEAKARLMVLAYNALVNPDVGDNLRLFVAALTKLPEPPSNES